jgi:hypothetical protein
LIELAVDFERKTKKRLSAGHELNVSEEAVEADRDYVSEDHIEEQKAERNILHGDLAGEPAESSAFVRVVCYFKPDQDEDDRVHTKPNIVLGITDVIVDEGIDHSHQHDVAHEGLHYDFQDDVGC